MRSRVFLVGQLARVAVQGLYFVALARLLGVDDYGAVASLLAVVAAVQPFSSLGAISLIMPNVARDPRSARTQWANCLTIVVASGSLGSLLLLVLSDALVPDRVSRLVVLAVAVSDLVLVRIVEGAAYLHNALEHAAGAAMLPVVVQAARAVSLALLVLGGGLDAWAVSYSLAVVPVAAVVVVRTTRRVGRARPDMGSYLRQSRVGLALTVGQASMTLNNDVDKVVLGRASTLEVTGLYAAAYRLIDMSYAPIRALLSAANPEMWRAGTDGRLSDVLAVARRRLLTRLTAYGVAWTCLVVVLAPLLPLVLGRSFDGSVVILRLLAPLVLVKGLQYLLSDSLACAGRHRERTTAQIVVVVLNLVLCLLLTPIWGWAGAVAATYAAEGLLLATFLLLAVRVVRAERAMSATLVNGDS
jgi:O-antigen/teichoic acid export membrane protein